MARIRTIKPEFWTSEQVLECSPIARLLFIGMWNFCDDGGNTVDSERTLKAQVFPADDISASDVRRLLDELSSNGLIVKYSNENKDFLHVTGWKHQKIDRPTLKHPPFPGYDSRSNRRDIVEPSPPEGKGREGKGEEGNKASSSLRSDSSPASPNDPADPPKLELLNSHPADPAPSKAERLAQVTADAIEAFNACPKLTKSQGGNLSNVSATVGRETRQGNVKRVIETARAICLQDFDSDRITPEFWADYFAVAAKDDFHAGRVPGGDGHARWVPDFEFLTRPATMLKLYDRAASEGEAA